MLTYVSTSFNDVSRYYRSKDETQSAGGGDDRLVTLPDQNGKHHHSVVIKEVHDNHVIASWNGNAPRRFGETAITGWKKEKPLLIRDRSGSARLATREEKARILDTK